MKKFVLCGITSKHLCENFFAKIVQSASYCSRLSKELKKVYPIQWPEVGLNKGKGVKVHEGIQAVYS